MSHLLGEEIVVPEKPANVPNVNANIVDICIGEI